jgi:hypothetical protein
LYLAEKEKGSPPYGVDVFRVGYKRTYMPVYPNAFTITALEDMYYNDEILSDQHFHRYSLDPKQQHTDENPTGMHLYSDYMFTLYPTCILDPQSGVLSPKPDAPMLNFNQLKDLLLSKDLSRVQELEWMQN